MLTVKTVFTSLVALHALLASTGQGQVEASVLRRDNGGHTGRKSHVIRGLLNVAGHDESFQRRQSGCDIGFYPCSDGTGCCPNGQACTTQNNQPTCCCSSGGNCPTGQLPCSANVAVCCPNGDLCSSTGACTPSGSGGGGGGGNGGGGSGGGNGGSGGGNGGGSGGGNGGGSGGSGSSGGLGGGGGGGGGGFSTTTSSFGAPGTTFSGFASSSPAFGGGLGGTTSSPLVVTPIVTVTSTPGPTGLGGTTLGNGEAGLRAGSVVVMMGSVIVASGLALMIL